jgi:predicted dienelactone hydrolase
MNHVKDSLARRIALSAILSAALLGTIDESIARDAAGQRFSVGYRATAFSPPTTAGTTTTRALHVWYPSSERESRHDYRGQIGYAARDGAVAVGRFPLVVFSHGYLGAGDQSIFLTENLARMGYIVVAPNHADAIGSDSGAIAPAALFTQPKAWTDETFRDRQQDIVWLLDEFERADADKASPFMGRVDTARIAVVGHSLGGYTALGLAGARERWSDARVKAIVALSPYVAPYFEGSGLGNVRTPVLLQGGTLDIGITPTLGRAYDALPGAKYFLVLRGENHFAWTNLIALGKTTTDAVKRGNARWMTGYTLAFLDQHLRGVDRSRLLLAPNRALSSYRYAADGR